MAPPSKGKYLAPIKVVAAERHVIHHLRERGTSNARPRPPDSERPRRAGGGACDGAPLFRRACGCRARSSPRRLSEGHVATPRREGHHLPGGVSDPPGRPRAEGPRGPCRLLLCRYLHTPHAQRVACGPAFGGCGPDTAASLVVDGERFAYALCRPPGHHAERRIYGGFCYLNNAAVAAHYLSRRGRSPFWISTIIMATAPRTSSTSAADVLTLSIHGHPSHAYPNFSGYADERGEGRAEASTAIGRSIRRWMTTAIWACLKRRWRHRAGSASVSSSSRWDSISCAAIRPAPSRVTTKGMDRIGRRIGDLRLPTLVGAGGGLCRRQSPSRRAGVLRGAGIELVLRPACSIGCRLTIAPRKP